MTSERTLKISLKRYYISTAAFFASLSLLLFTLVEMRRAFLFSDYFKVGAPSTLLNLDLRQLPLLLIGGLGIWLSYRYMKRHESGLKENGVNLKFVAKVLAIAIGAFLVVDLFIYRGVPASRFVSAGEMSAGTGTMGIGQAIPVASFPGWLQPLGEGLNYLLVVWHATFLGMLLGGLFLVAGAGLIVRLRGRGFGTHLAGVAMALPQPFCSCCAAPVGSALYRKGASLGPVLAFMVSSPMLNITGLILAAALLPLNLAILRIVGGILVGVFLTYAVSRIASRWVVQEEAEARPVGRLSTLLLKGLDAYNRLFLFEKLCSEEASDSPVAFITSWLSMSWRLTRFVVPILLIGATIAVYIVKAVPDTVDSVAGVAVTAIFGPLLMVPTWTEIPFAAGLVNEGLTGAAATVLITLPAVSLPALVIAAGAIRSLRVMVILGLFVMLAGILAGIIFL